MVFKGPATGGLEGAWRGMRIGFVDPILVGAKLSGPGSGAIPFLAGVGLAPVGALMGGVVGAVAAQPKAKMEEKGAVIRTALNELKIQEAFSGCASSALRERAPHIARGSEGESSSTMLEVTVETFGLDGDSWMINPPLRLVMTERTRMIRASDGAELYTHRFTWRGQLRPLDDWVAQAPTLLKKEAGWACQSLAESLVDEVFFLYLATDER